MNRRDITWGDEFTGGSIAVTPTGVQVHNQCHGCTSTRLTGLKAIRDLKDALEELLYAKEGHR